MKGGRHFGDRAFKWLTLLMALAVFVLIGLIGFELAKGSHLALRKFGWRFLVSPTWDPVAENFGALPFIFGTIVSSAIALLIAVPLSIATAVFLTEMAPQWLRQPLTMLHRTARRHPQRHSRLVGHLRHGALAADPRVSIAA